MFAPLTLILGFLGSKFKLTKKFFYFLQVEFYGFFSQYKSEILFSLSFYLFFSLYFFLPVKSKAKLYFIVLYII